MDLRQPATDFDERAKHPLALQSDRGQPPYLAYEQCERYAAEISGEDGAGQEIRQEAKPQHPRQLRMPITTAKAAAATILCCSAQRLPPERATPQELRPAI